MIPLTRPWLDESELDAIRDAILSGWVAQGPQVARFEQTVADYCGAAHAVAVCNCTAALHLALLVLEVGPGDEVICPSMSFIATANAIRYTGASPVFVDVDPRTFNVDPSAVEQAITAQTKAILVVHQLGLPADIDAIARVAQPRGIQVVEDAACALGSRYRGRPIGAHSSLVCFSFHPRKLITTGEGGMISTNDPTFAERLRLLRQHGMNVDAAKRHESRRVTIERYDCLGYNYRLTDIQAAMGVRQMDRLEEILQRRRSLAERYNQELAGHPWFMTPFVPHYAIPNYQSYALRMASDAPLGRDKVMQILLDHDIHTRRGVMLSHLEPAYAGWPLQHSLTASIEASDRSLLIPLYPQMTYQEQDQVIRALNRLTLS